MAWGSVCSSVCACGLVPRRDKTPEEEALEAEVEQLRIKLEGLKELEPGETDTLEQLAAELDEREKSLYKLQVSPAALQGSNQSD